MGPLAARACRAALALTVAAASGCGSHALHATSAPTGASAAATPQQAGSSTAGPPGIADQILTVDFVDALHGWAGGAAGIYGTGDGGRSWHAEPSAALTVQQLDFVSASDGWALGSAGLLRTQDGGSSWQPLPAPSGLSGVDFEGPGAGWAQDRTGGLYATADGGESWKAVEVPVPVAGMTLLTPEDGWVVGAGEILRTADGGQTWQVGASASGGAAWAGPAWVLSSAGGAGWALLTTGQGAASQEAYLLYRTADGGQHWGLVLIGSGSIYPATAPSGQINWGGPRPSAPLGPGGYPVGLWAAGAAAGLAVNSPAGGFLQLTTVGAAGAAAALATIPGDFLSPQGNTLPMSPVIAFGSPTAGWLAGATPQTSGLWSSTDGGRTWQVAPALP